MGAPAAMRPGVSSAHRCRLPAPSIFRRSVRPLTTGLERAARRGSVGSSGTTRALPREAGPARRAVSTGVDSAPRGIDRPRPQVPQRPAACSCERRWRRGGTRAGGSLRSRGAWAGGRRARARAGHLRAAGGVGRGRCARSLAVGRREGGSRWCACLAIARCVRPASPPGTRVVESGNIEPFYSLWGCNRCAGCSLDLAP